MIRVTSGNHLKATLTSHCEPVRHFQTEEMVMLGFKHQVTGSALGLSNSMTPDQLSWCSTTAKQEPQVSAWFQCQKQAGASQPPRYSPCATDPRAQQQHPARALATPREHRGLLCQPSQPSSPVLELQGAGAVLFGQHRVP